MNNPTSTPARCWSIADWYSVGHKWYARLDDDVRGPFSTAQYARFELDWMKSMFVWRVAQADDDACRLVGDMSSRGPVVVSGLLITETV